MKQKSTGVASLLSFFWPGFGQVYNGQVFKGLLFGIWHLIALASIVASASPKSTEVLIIGSISLLFWLMCIYDARHIAKLSNEGSKTGQWRGTGRVILFSFGVVLIIALITGVVVQSGGQIEIPLPSLPKTESPPKLDPEKEYIRFVRLENLMAGKGYTRFDFEGISPSKRGIYGSVRNLGDKTLKRVKATFYFLNKEGVRVGEKSFLVISNFPILADDGPLKPNYVKDFGFSVEDDAPSEWSGRLEAEITEIGFLEQG